MFLVDPGISWLAEPNLYQHEGFIASQDEIRAIARQGYVEACYDPIRSQIVRNLESPPRLRRRLQKKYMRLGARFPLPMGM